MDGRNPDQKPFNIAILWRGDAEARRTATPHNNRFYRIFEELADLGIKAEPAIYDEAFADEVREQLLSADGVLVWVDPIHQGKTREALDALLRDVASRGPWVSAHPDVILKMGVKEVLYWTKHLGWGSDTHLYRTAAEFSAALPSRLQSSGPRVIKQNRGNGVHHWHCGTGISLSRDIVTDRRHIAAQSRSLPAASSPMARTPVGEAGVLEGGALLPVRDGLSAGGKRIRTTGPARISVRFRDEIRGAEVSG
ncbi:MAG: Cj0069 family protein [Alphaproteobacteria bacterium]|nr:Cj0069 family protein [Alphaproteobacteria bacterium]